MRSLTRVSVLAAAMAFASPAVAQESAAEPAEADADTPFGWLLSSSAPKTTSDSGWSFKPRGRVQLDAGWVDTPEGIAEIGLDGEVRRAFAGFDVSSPGGFSLRAEVDLASDRIEFTEIYLAYQASDALTLTVGQHKPFWGLEEMTSDLFPSFTERAAINTSFGYERRLGASAVFVSGPVLVQGGVFTDHIQDLDDAGDALSFDGRVVLMPKLAGGRLHLGGSVHRRDYDEVDSVRYRTRPLIHTTDIRFIDTGAIATESETGYGLEAAFIKGPFHAAAEAHWQQVGRPAAADPTFFGYYFEAGMFLTKGDTRGYDEGEFARVKPAKPVGKGGIGAVQVVARYDYVDLIDAGIVGGTQRGYELALSWTPTAYTRFIANYGHMAYDRAARPAAGGDRSYGADAFGVRAQFDF
jgi:phosphate-selective porin OprO/OprP